MFHLVPVRQLAVILDKTHNVVSFTKWLVLYLGQQSWVIKNEKQRAGNTALRGTGVKGDGFGDIIVHMYRLSSVSEEVQWLVANNNPQLLRTTRWI